MSLRTFFLSWCLPVCLCYLLHSQSPDFFLLSTRCLFFSCRFFFTFHSHLFIPALQFSLSVILCISQYLLNLCSVLLFPLPCLSPPSLVLEQRLYWGDKIGRCLPCSLLSQTVHFSVSHKALELTRWVWSSKNSQEKLHFPEDFEQIWVRRGMSFVKRALWS